MKKNSKASAPSAAVSQQAGHSGGFPESRGSSTMENHRKMLVKWDLMVFKPLVNKQLANY